MRLLVNFGNHSRTILAGFRKERGTPQEIVGMQALFVVNLESRKMAGEISEGMLFDLGYADGITAGSERHASERMVFSGLDGAKKIGKQAIRGSFQAGVVLHER
jgi:tRNA-binding EMAP/Myf-like protein